MEPVASAYERLLDLERDLEQLKEAMLPQAIRARAQFPLPPRHIWPGDELLLNRLLRRSPEAIQAYQCHAELNKTEQRGLRLTPAEGTSVFQLCEMMDGDAVAWVNRQAMKLALRSDSFRLLFSCPSELENPEDLILQVLPLFKPISRGQAWTLHRRGEMVLQLRPSPEQAEHSMLLRRLEQLERRHRQQSVQLDAEIKDLRSQLRLQQIQIERLLRLSPSDSGISS